MRDFAQIAQYPVLLLDMNKTFMFGGDQFGPGHDCVATYRALGGTLPTDVVNKVLKSVFEYLDKLYPDPSYHDCFPTVRGALLLCSKGEPHAPQEVDILEHTFALHERGRVPAEYAAVIKQLAGRRRLGLVADIWSKSELWIEELDRAGVLPFFETLVFSSDYGCVKPALRLFQIALEKMGAEPSECLFVGDSARRDIAGAKAAGIATLWIGAGPPPDDADWVISDLRDLVLNGKTS